MITVSMLLSKKEFSSFKLICGENGLNNPVSCAGFFDWEDDDAIKKDFPPDILVFTTLSMFKDNLREAERYLKVLINNKIAGIAIKNVFVNDISDDLRAYAEAHAVPIFIFSGTYINDLTRLIQNEIDNDRNYSVNERILERIIRSSNLSNKDKQALLYNINPYFEIGCMAALFISDNSKIILSAEKLTNQYRDVINCLNNVCNNIGGGKGIFNGFALYKRGVFLVLSGSKEIERAMVDYLSELKRRLKTEKELKDYHIGVGNMYDGNNIEAMFKSAIISNTTAILENEQIKCFDEIGVDSVIFGNMRSEYTELFFKTVMDSISEAEHTGTPFLETLLAYVQCKGNIEKTSEMLHQHKNTVRYRIDKINKLFGGSDTITTTGNLFFFTRVYKARPYLDQLI